MTNGTEVSGASRPFEGAAIATLRRRIAWAVHRTCPLWLVEERDDLVQDAVLRVLDLACRGEVTAAPPTSYLLRVAHSVVMDEIRRRDRRRAAPLTDAERDGIADPSAAGAHPGREPRHDPREIGRSILDCLSRLVLARRRAVTLHLLGHGVPETAERLDIDYKKASNLVFRGLADLRRCLSAKGMTP